MIDASTCLGRLLRVARGTIAISAGFVAPIAVAVQCSVSVTPVNFGAYDILSGFDTVSTGSARVSCTREPTDSPSVRVTYTVTASTGSSNSFAGRTLRGPADTLAYNLYTTSNYTTIWGNGSNATQAFSGGFTVNQGNPTRTASHTVYGRITKLQDVGSGNYSDNITVTVTF